LPAQTHERSGGVTAAAVLLFLGGAVAGYRGGWLLLQLYLGRQIAVPQSLQAAPIEVRTIMIAGGIVFAALAAWGFATAFGLLKQKPWARFSILVFSVLALVWSAVSMLSIYLAVRNLRTDLTSAVPFLLFRAVLKAAVPGLIGLSWLFYFNRKAVRSQFAKFAG